jgi:hypothetical protein
MDAHGQTGELAFRLREMRMELFGSNGVARLARALGIPERNWVGYEIGGPLAALVLLRFLSLTGAHPRWLLTGRGDRFFRKARTPVVRG